MIILERPIVFATLGHPGSGKTFFSKRFARDFNFYHLSSDIVRHEIFSRPKYNTEENFVVFKTMDLLANELISRGVSIIYDANLTRRIFRQRLWEMTKKSKASYFLLWFQTPIELALKRVNKRNKNKSFVGKPIKAATVLSIKAEEEEPIEEPFIALTPTSYNKQRELVINFLSNNKTNI